MAVAKGSESKLEASLGASIGLSNADLVEMYRYVALARAVAADPAVLVPWLKTVVKHEAFAARRQRERHSPVTDDGDVADPGSDAGSTHDKAAHLERLRQGAEAMSVLKPQELRALNSRSSMIRSGSDLSPSIRRKRISTAELAISLTG